MAFLIAANYLVADKTTVEEYIKSNLKLNALADSTEMVISSDSETSVNHTNETR